jgi:hypothetical protein
MDETEITTGNLAKLFDVTSKTIADLGNRGVIVRAGRGRWQMQASVAGGVVTLSEIGPIWTINQQAKSLKFLASTSAIVGKFRSV